MSSMLTPATFITRLLAAEAALCPRVGADDAWLALPQPRVCLQCSTDGISNSRMQHVAPPSAGHRCCALSWMLCGLRASTTSALCSCLAPTPLARRKSSWRWHGPSSARCGLNVHASHCQQQQMCMFVYHCRARQVTLPCSLPVTCAAYPERWLRLVASKCSWHAVVHGCKWPAIDGAGFVHMEARTARRSSGGSTRSGGSKGRHWWEHCAAGCCRDTLQPADQRALLSLANKDVLWAASLAN